MAKIDKVNFIVDTLYNTSLGEYIFREVFNLIVDAHTSNSLKKYFHENVLKSAIYTKFF